MDAGQNPIGRAARETERLVREEGLSPAMAVATACAVEGIEDQAVLKLLKDWSELSKRLAS